MPRSFAKPSSVSPSAEAEGPPLSVPLTRLEQGASIVALWAVVFWMGGLLALGAIAAPVVFAVVPLPTSADAMTIVFRRFDVVAMACAAVVLASEAARAVFGVPFRRLDHVRCLASLAAAALAVFEATRISPAIAALHAQGVLRGAGALGLRLSRLHDWATACAEGELVTLAVAVALHVVTLSRGRSGRTRAAPMA